MRPPFRHWTLAVGTAAAVWLLLACTAPGIPIVWDEGEYLYRADRILDWLRLLVDPGNPAGGLAALSRASIHEHWLFITWAEGHSAWFAIPIALSKGLLSGWLHPLTAARLGPITVFSMACGAVAHRLRKEYGLVAALAAPVALVTFPRIFSEAHFATQDGQLTAWWLMLWVADSSLCTGMAAAFGSGVLLGLTSATKFAGWLAWIPTIASRLFTPRAARWRDLLVLLPIALLTFCAVNPPIWHDPISGLSTHFRLNLQRASTFDIPIVFLGHMYRTSHSLPWYNTIAWLVMVAPIPTLALGLLGLRDCLVNLIRRDRMSVSLLLHWATLMVVRALPGAPPHDGVRLFLPALGFWCVLAGIGAQRIWDAAAGLTLAWKRTLVRAAVVVSVAAGAVDVARYYPQTLSHYSLLIGGVRGAERMGMEPAYWWDALDNDVLSWLNEHTEPGAALAFSPISNMTQLHEWHRLRARDVDPRKEVFTWYVLQNRTGMLTEVDRTLLRGATPAYTKYAGRRSPASGVPADLQSPLIVVFSYRQYQEALSASGVSRSSVY
jgi:hypothetical protein